MMAEKAKELYPEVPPQNPARVSEYMVPGCPEEPDAKEIKIYVAKPEKCKKKMPCIFFIVAGGLILSAPEVYPLADLAEKYDAVYVTFAYRTIFDEKGAYPGTINDCHAAYKYIHDHAAADGSESP